MTIELSTTTIHRCPHRFTNRRAERILITTLTAPRHRQLIDMYLSYEPRNSFSGLPPIRDDACVRWVETMIATGANLLALSPEGGVIGHGGLFPANKATCEMLIVVSPAYQKVGIGAELARCLTRLGHELGFQEIRLSVEAGNHVARHIYEKTGFEYLTRGLTHELDMNLDLDRRHAAADAEVQQRIRQAAGQAEPGPAACESTSPRPGRAAPGRPGWRRGCRAPEASNG